MKLYSHPQSPPSRALYMTLGLLGKDPEYIFVDVMRTRNHHTKEYLSINPQHAVPAFVDDDGFTMNESRATMEYVVNKYGTPEQVRQLLGATLQERARVHQRLYFESEYIFQRTVKHVVVRTFRKEKTIQPEVKATMQEAFDWLEEMVKPTGYIAGTEYMTIADISALATVTGVWTTKDNIIDWSRCPEVVKWMNRVKAQIPRYEKTNQPGVDFFENFFREGTGLI